MLTFWDRQPPLAALALAQHAGVPLSHEADPKATKETVAKMTFPSGWVAVPDHPAAWRREPPA